MNIENLTSHEVLAEVFARLEILANGELKQAAELLTMVQEMAPNCRIDLDLDSLAGLTRKAHLRQRVGHAYKWAAQDIKTYLGIEVSDEEFREAVKNHPTERS
jgi:hypothetical protein